MSERIIIRDEIFYWNKKDFALFYDSEKSDSYLIDKTLSNEVRSFCDTLSEENNLQSLIVDYDALAPDLSSIVEELKNKGFIRCADAASKDCSMPRKLFVNGDIDNITDPDERLKKIKEKFSILDVNTVNFYVGGDTVPNSLFKQCLYPVSSSQRLPYDGIFDFISKIESINTAVRYNIVVSDFVDLEELFAFVDRIGRIKSRLSFHILYLEKSKASINKLAELGLETIIIDNKYDVPDNKLPTSANYRYVVRNERDFDLMKNYKQSRMRPLFVYDNNTEFIKRTMFFKREELLRIRTPKNLVFAHQKINVNYWGKLYIYPDGSVYPSPVSLGRAKAIGHYTNSVESLVVNEIKENYAWRFIRDAPECRKCTFQWLCPSPSNIETLIKSQTVCYE